MTERKVRILMARFGEGFEHALPRISKAFSEAGFEVIYLDFGDPAAIAAAALQESVDHIGITTLPGTRVEHLEILMERLKELGLGEVGVTAGGLLEEQEAERILKVGIEAFFPRQTTFDELIRWARENIQPVNHDL